ncbi:MAG: fused MFS/spermidine synthase [Burkholderiales bacterium]
MTLGRSKKWKSGTDHSVSIAEERGVRSLHIGGLAIQSAMRLSNPDALELHYTRAMMSFMLFCPRPKDLLMVGLGGGSMAKFLYRRLTDTRLTVVEIRAEVVAAARSYFEFPSDDRRMRVMVGDGARYVPANPASVDVLLLDGFEDGVQPRDLCSQDFYDSAFAALRPGGVLVVNFMAEDPRLDAMCMRLEKSFAGRTLLLEAADKVNVVVLALRDGPGKIAWSELRTAAAQLQGTLDLPFDKFLVSLRERNVGNARYLRIDPEDI